LTRVIETSYNTSMLAFKRNQVEEAISRVLEPNLREPTTELRTRLKRLLDTDRALGCSPKSTNAEDANYAFYSDKPPGSGTEVWFSGYEAFALLTGLRLMGHEWPQGFAVSVMRRVRPELERQHARVMTLDPQKLFDQEEIFRNARPGDMAFDNIDPVLLIIASPPRSASNDQPRSMECSISRGPAEAWEFVRNAYGGFGAAASTMFELTTVAHRLSRELTKTEPRRRGRGQ
jgi:hypothetical protein